MTVRLNLIINTWAVTKQGIATAIYWRICPNCDKLTLYLKNRLMLMIYVLGDSTDVDNMTIVYSK